MSTKRCARCEKTVYPLEELKCLDKIWHKGCFKCQECGMTLNMKTYKGFSKLPYCNAHCPQAKHTTVADTPEARRLAENTRIQSQVKYHEDFEKLKGKVTQVADDPETMRIRQTSKIISNVAYHGELERKNLMEQQRVLLPEKNGVQQNGQGLDAEKVLDSFEFLPPPPHDEPPEHSQQARMLSIDPQTNNNSPYSAKLQSTVIYTSEDGPVQAPPSRKVGSIADYDPLNDNYGSCASGYVNPQQQYYKGTETSSQQMGNQKYTASQEQAKQHMMSRQHMANQHMPTQQHMASQHQMASQQHMMPMQPPPSAGRAFRAMYDYIAQDTDEVSFLDGDIIVCCIPIDEGWMTGTVQRTGQSGMLPANYVEPC
ncbi:LIM zinc-binding domain-containing Nebulette-like isoform X2 [Ornithodoros turicata]|uniref:LIM zinc-binding domain-containing Nebulette-like isoform X2 n=1 Tax=Ornithodoros turicata TaxID=34597 RepID=UPI003139D841